MDTVAGYYDTVIIFYDPAFAQIFEDYLSALSSIVFIIDAVRSRWCCIGQNFGCLERQLGFSSLFTRKLTAMIGKKRFSRTEDEI